MTTKPRQSAAVTLVLAIWLFCSPYFIRYASTDGVAAWNSYVLGFALALFAIAALVSRRKWTGAVILGLGLWLVAAPFALGLLADDLIASINHVVVGVLVVTNATWALVRPPTASHA